MNFSTIKTEISARGFDTLGDTRLGQYTNFAYHQFQTSDEWPWRRAVSSTASWSSATITLTNASKVLTVGYSSAGTDFTELAELPYEEMQVMEEAHSGTPEYFSVTADTSTPTTLNVDINPHSATWTIRIVYLKTYADLTGTDIPTVPTPYHGTLVDMAVEMAERDRGNHQAADELKQRVDADLQRIRGNVFDRAEATK